jgi:hypothetical protein
MSVELMPSEDQADLLDRIVRELDAPQGVLPEEALRAAQRHAQEIVPKLIEVLHQTRERAAAGELPTGNAHFFALFLLTEFRVKEALSAIAEIMSLPGRSAAEMFGDAKSETLPRTLALLDHDERATIDKMISNRSIDEFTRWGAVVSYSYLVQLGSLTRDQAIASLVRHFREAVATGDEAIVTPLICELADFDAIDMLDEIREVYRLGLVDESIVGLEEVERDFKHFDPQRPGLGSARREAAIQDTVEELREWACFDEKYKAIVTKRGPTAPSPLPPDSLVADPAVRRDLALPAEPIRRTTPHVGRNDPCPCGSRRKFKKCCGAR